MGDHGRSGQAAHQVGAACHSAFRCEPAAGHLQSSVAYSPCLALDARSSLVLTALSRLLQLAAARHTAALVIAKVAAIELPRGEWRELIAALLANMSTTPPNSGLQQATLQALGYVCEEMGYLADDVLDQEQINSILTAVVQVCSPLEPSWQDLSCRV